MSRKQEINEPFSASADYGYSPAQWTKVTRDFETKLKIDVAKPIQFAEPWNDRKPVTRPLGDALRELAAYYGALARLEDHRFTPKQRAVKAKQMLRKLKAVLAAISDYYDDGDTLELRMRSAAVLRDLVLRIERRKQRYDKDAATHDGRSQNPVATHTRLWLALMEVWRGLETERHQKLLCEFLLICSKPIFPKATTDATLTAFIERRFRQTNI
jgi:hypothetical protein